MPLLALYLIFLVFAIPESQIVNGQDAATRNQGTAENFPKSFPDCVDAISYQTIESHQADSVQNVCLDRFISIDHTDNWTANFTRDEQNYIKSIFRKVISEASQLKSRQKRSTNALPIRARREVRDKQYQNWLDYARNVQRLKFETITPTGRSKYNIIADIHSTAILSAHYGPNFLPWHRLYILVMESALGVPVPYWDSSMDFELQDPTQSILWSKRYFGNGFGYVKTGPFANFQTPVGALFRNIGSDGRLFDFRGLQRIFKQLRLAEISDPTAGEMNSLEGQHNDVHIWVDGQMNNLDLSPHDPVFFTHHCFVDYIWELFRTLQNQRGIDPTTDTITPPMNVTLQNITDPAVGLTGYYNSDGYSKFIANMAKYLPHPKCPHCSKSPDLYCDKRKQVCVSKLRNQFEYTGTPLEAMEAAKDCGMVTGGSHSNPFALYMRDPRARMDSVTMNYNQNMNMNGNDFMKGMKNGMNGNQIVVQHGASMMNGIHGNQMMIQNGGGMMNGMDNAMNGNNMMLQNREHTGPIIMHSGPGMHSNGPVSFHPMSNPIFEQPQLTAPDHSYLPRNGIVSNVDMHVPSMPHVRILHK